MTCEIPDCRFTAETDGTGVCFAHKAAAIADALCVVASKRKALEITVAGATVKLHPEGFEYPEHDDEDARRDAAKDADADLALEHEPSVRELVNGVPVVEQFPGEED